MAATGADVLEIDHAVDLTTACCVVRTETVLWGNIDPVGVLAQGTPEGVADAAQRALAAVRAEGRSGYVLSSGCTLAVETPAANLDALIAAP
jgi:uroporphyrinogen decarboxylase